MQALLVKVDSKWWELVYTCFGGGKNDIFELIQDSDAENTKRRVKYAVSRRYLKIMIYLRNIKHFPCWYV